MEPRKTSWYNVRKPERMCTVTLEIKTKHYVQMILLCCDDTRHLLWSTCRCDIFVNNGPFHFAHAMMILWFCSCNCSLQRHVFKRYPFRCEASPNSAPKSHPISGYAMTVWSVFAELPIYNAIILLRVYTKLSQILLTSSVLFANAESDNYFFNEYHLNSGHWLSCYSFIQPIRKYLSKTYHVSYLFPCATCEGQRRKTTKTFPGHSFFFFFFFLSLCLF